MVVGGDQKLAVVLSDDDAGAHALRLLCLRLHAVIAEHAEIVLYLLYGTVGDGHDGGHHIICHVRYAHFSGIGGCGGLQRLAAGGSAALCQAACRTAAGGSALRAFLRLRRLLCRISGEIIDALEGSRGHAAEQDGAQRDRSDFLRGPHRSAGGFPTLRLGRLRRVQAVVFTSHILISHVRVLAVVVIIF